MSLLPNDDTIVALATPSGSGAIAVIRLSGEDAIALCDEVFQAASGEKLANQKTHTLHFGQIMDGEQLIDEVLVSVFMEPHGFTGENAVEISCHGSVYIQQQIIQLLLRKGARMARQGEYTLRAFMNGKMDLSQAEAVADLVSSKSEAAHKIALQQMRGGFSSEIQTLREKLINFASLIELELDFSEEDVEFADRDDLKELVSEIQAAVKKLLDSFALGNVIKNGIPIAIAGEPNVGKSTLLNALLNEERAIVSEIAGTTRDTIEDEIVIEGIPFRFIDTAGIRETTDKIETIGIGRTFEKINQAALVLYLFDATAVTAAEIEKTLNATRAKINDPEKMLIAVINKIDECGEKEAQQKFDELENALLISAKEHINLDALKEKLLAIVNTGALESGRTIVSNSRHYDALNKAMQSLIAVQDGLAKNITGDFLAIDIRKALHHLGEITGEITTDDLLGNIFSRFCIGK